MNEINERIEQSIDVNHLNEKNDSFSVSVSDPADLIWQSHVGYNWACTREGLTQSIDIRSESCD